MTEKNITAEEIASALSCGTRGCSCSRKSGNGWITHCPAHDDRHPSLSISEGQDGKLLVKCFAGCPQDAVIEALKVKNLWPSRGKDNKLHFARYASITTVGLTLETLANAKQLPLDFLKNLGLSERKRGESPAVTIPYSNEVGEEVAVRYRKALTGGQRFAWRKGDKVCLYGLWRLQEIREAGWVLLVEGETDCWTCWLHGVPALGIPGKSTWKREWAEVLAGLKVYLWVEPDASELPVKVGADVPGLMVIHAPEGIKDISEAHLRGKDIPVMMEGLRDNASSVESLAQTQSAAEMEELRSQADSLLKSPDMLTEVVRILRSMGLAGQEREAKILYLALTSRVLDRPVNVAVKGLSSGGKSHLVAAVSRLFPKSAYHDLSAMSERALIYDQEPISHRFLIIYEAAGLGDIAQYILRSLLSEGRVKYTTLEKTEHGIVPRLIEREGPTGFITTTTAISLHPENETRMLSLEVSDTPDQTREVLLAHARRRSAKSPDLTSFLAFQRILDLEHPRVIIPFCETLAQECSPCVVRIRRDFPMVLTLIESHAILNATHRRRDAEGRIIATLDDYEAVHGLVADLVSYGAGRSVPADVKSTVWAVRELTGGDRNHEGVMATDVAKELKLDDGTVSRRIKKARKGGFIVNKETRGKGFAFKLVLGATLPEDGDSEVIPHPEVVAKKYLANPSETEAIVQQGADSPDETWSSPFNRQSKPFATAPTPGTNPNLGLQDGCETDATAGSPNLLEDRGAVAELRGLGEETSPLFPTLQMTEAPAGSKQESNDLRNITI